MWDSLDDTVSMWRKLINLNSIENVKIIMIFKKQFLFNVLKINDSNLDII